MYVVYIVICIALLLLMCYKKPIIGLIIIMILLYLSSDFRRHIHRFQNHLGFKSQLDESKSPFEIISVYNSDLTSNVIVFSLY